MGRADFPDSDNLGRPLQINASSALPANNRQGILMSVFYLFFLNNQISVCIDKKRKTLSILIQFPVNFLHIVLRC